MIPLLLTLIALLLACCLSVLVFSALKINRGIQLVVTRYQDFVSSDGTTPSELGLVANALAAKFATATALSIKTSLMGQASAVSKQIDAAGVDVASDALDAQNPTISALLAFSPKLKNRVLRSPALAAALGHIKLGGGGGSSPPVSVTSSLPHTTQFGL